MKYRRFGVLSLLSVTTIFLMPNTARNQTKTPIVKQDRHAQTRAAITSAVCGEQAMGGSHAPQDDR